MARKSKEYYDSIDLANLFSQWHRDVRTFIEGKNKDCILNLLKSGKISTFDTSKFNEVLNLANSRNCKTTLERIINEKNESKFLEILKERDYLFPRNISRGFSVEEIFEAIFPLFPTPHIITLELHLLITFTALSKESSIENFNFFNALI